LISEKNPAPPAAQPLLTRDTRGDLSAAENAWSDQLAGLVHALRSAPRFEPTKILPRPDALVELLLVSLLAFAGTVATGVRNLAGRIIAGVLVAGLGGEFLYLFASRQNAWLPPLALLCPGLIALGLSFRKAEPVEAVVADRPEAVVAPESPAMPEPVAVAAPTEYPPARAWAPPEEIPLHGQPLTEDRIPQVIKRVRLREMLFLEKPPTDEAPAETAAPEKPVSVKTTARKAATKVAAKKAAKKAPSKKAARRAAPKSPDASDGPDAAE
jgi:hypothetical protein